MLWLFGQIWLWLLIAFLLGALVMWLIMRAGRPKRSREPAASAAGAGSTSGSLPAVPEPSDAERTQYIPVPTYDYDEQPERVYNDYPAVDPDEPYAPDEPSGHRIGRLPDPEPHLSGDLNWPAAEEPADEWPHNDEPRESAPRRPGRGG
ncbi:MULTISPECIES: LapA family protein [unclassified Amycolatopsis]|uniref:LapA family protein n=1 Tax=unclassified Amycolatopsis TaxID=2618356 RepID=UPI001C69FE53|nr:LapA family protein [Amycolatopsis sp. DSM 110486]QYN23456.1 LapA family protein [Amycolatopsis sp. DSM 110486]